MSDEANTDHAVHTAVNDVIGTLLPFDEQSRLRIHRTVATFFRFDEKYSKVVKLNDTLDDPEHTAAADLTAKDFLHEKQPKTDVERVTCLAYYLARYRDTRQFKTIDISKLNTEAAQVKLANASTTINNATKSGYLVAATRGMKQISANGEKYVEALPNQTAAKEIRSRMRPARVRRRTNATTPPQGSTSADA